MANKHSRQGLALGVSLAMGSTLISGLPAAADYENLTIQIANETTNGVLATTMGSSFDVETEWDLTGSQQFDLAWLKYDISAESSDGSAVSAYGMASRVTYDPDEDDVDINAVDTAGDVDWGNLLFTSQVISAPAAIVTDDERVDYTRTVMIASETGATVNIICNAGSAIVVDDSNTPPTDYTYRTSLIRSDGIIDNVDGSSNAINDPTDVLTYSHTGTPVTGGNVALSNTAGTADSDNDPVTMPATTAVCPPTGIGTDRSNSSYVASYRDYNVTYSAGTGYAGPANFLAPINFESILRMNSVTSSADYVDVTVKAWLDKDNDGVVDPTESYSAPITVRFWNPDALTASLSVDETWVCDAADNSAGGCTVNFTDATAPAHDYFQQAFTVTVDQELNNAYTEEDTFDNLFEVFNYVDNLGASEPLIRNGNVAYDGFYDNDADEDGAADVGGTPVLTRSYWSSTDAYYESLDEDFVSSATSKFFSTSGQTIEAQLNYEVDTDDNHIGLVHKNDVDAVANAVAIADSSEADGEFAFLYWLNIMDGTDGYNYRHITASGATGAVVEETLVKAVANQSTLKNDAIVRIDDETVTYVVTVTGGVAGDEVEVEFDTNTAMTVNGEDFASGTSHKVEGVLDANRAITLNIVNEDPTASDYLDITDVRSQTQSFAVVFEIDWDASAWVLTADRLFDGEATVQVGSTFNMTYTVEDQWSQVPGAGLAVVEFDAAGVGGLANRDYGMFSPDFNVSNGAFTVSLPDTNPAAGEGRGDFALKLYTRASTSVGYTLHSTTNVSVWYLNDVAVDEVSIPGGQDTTANVAYVSAADLDSADAANFSNGYIENAAGVELSGHLVTVSGPGVLFKSGTLSGTGSLTFYTNRDGEFSFMAAHTLVGTHTITITSGGKSTTETFTITSASVRAQNVALSAFDGKAGTVSDIHATVTDTYGNLVDAGTSVTFRRTAGAGYFVPTNGDYAYPVQVTASTGATGVATAQLVVLPGEVGFSTTINASIVHENGGQTVAAQRTAGDTLSGSIQPHAWTKLQDDGTVKMYAKNIVGVGKVQFFHNGGEIAWVRAADALNPKLREANGAYYLVRTRDLLEGKNVFEIYIDGERVRRTAYSK